MLHLFIDTSTLLDLSKHRDGQKWLVSMRVLENMDALELLVPEVIVDEFERNRDKVETSMTTTVAQRFKRMRQDLGDYGGADYEAALKVVEGLSHEVTLISAMTTRNFNDVLELIKGGRALTPSDVEHAKVVQRGLDKRAPFHRTGKNSVADALLIELYATAISTADLAAEPHAFITSNSDDFSLANGDQREPHADIADMFVHDGSTYGLGIDGLSAILLAHYGDEIKELVEHSVFLEEPRTLAEITTAEQEMFDRIWYHRSHQFSHPHEPPADPETVSKLQSMEQAARLKVENTYTQEGQLGPYTDFELGMLNGKLSALRWMLGSEWDFLDT